MAGVEAQDRGDSHLNGMYAFLSLSGLRAELRTKGRESRIVDSMPGDQESVALTCRMGIRRYVVLGGGYGVRRVWGDAESDTSGGRRLENSVVVCLQYNSGENYVRWSCCSGLAS